MKKGQLVQLIPTFEKGYKTIIVGPDGKQLNIGSTNQPTEYRILPDEIGIYLGPVPLLYVQLESLFVSTRYGNQLVTKKNPYGFGALLLINNHLLNVPRSFILAV